MRKYILFILSFISLQSYGQEHAKMADSPGNSVPFSYNEKDTTNYASLYEQEYVEFIQLEDSLNLVKVVKKNLQTANNILQDAVNEKQAQLNLKNEQLSSSKSAQASSGILELKSRQEDLYSSIKGLNIEIARLNKEISLVVDEISSLQNQKKELDLIKEEISNEILGKYELYLELPFSEISEERLIQIERECNGYTVDPKIDSFVLRIGSILKYKRLYEKAKVVSMSKFNKSYVQNSISALSVMNDINERQVQEISKVKKQLELFEEGVHVFKEFIIRLNAKRDGLSRYSPSDFRDDLPYIKSGLEEKIDIYIMSVPYLSREYEKYMEIIKFNPMEHPTIEREILGL